MELHPVEIDVAPAGRAGGARLEVRWGERVQSYSLAGTAQSDIASFYDRLSADFGTRTVRNSLAGRAESSRAGWTAILPEPDPGLERGYGDPAVFADDDGSYWLVVTSNDAPDAFPTLRSTDLARWDHVGFVFPAGRGPDWTLPGPAGGDYWAPEMARVGNRYWLVYTARNRSRSLSVGIAFADSLTGPWIDLGRPLLTGGAIDAHLFVDCDGAPWLFWKRDCNGIWPRPLAALLRSTPGLANRLFDDERDRRTAAFAAAIEPFASTREPIERFFWMQPLIRAVAESWPAVPSRLTSLGIAEDIVEAMTTPILAQRLAGDGTALVGEPILVLVNDLDWEAHLVEGPWVTRRQGRYWLFYAGNDFTSANYGIGVASSDRLLGPYVKQDEPLLRSCSDWLAPGHASIANGPDSTPHIFFHAYRPGTGGYNVFRSLMSAPLAFSGGRVAIELVGDQRSGDPGDPGVEAEQRP